MSVIKNFLIGLDQASNCLVKLSDGWGKPDEMLSARAWRLRERHPQLRLWIDRLFFWDTDHCRGAYETERSGRQLPLEYGA